MDLIIRGGMCVTLAGVIRADVGVRDGRIVALAESLDEPAGAVVDADGQWVYPGGVDVHCHLPWPSKSVLSGDDLLSGTRAAICGGVTTVLDFVIPELGEPLLDAVERKLDETRAGLYADYAAHVCVREVNERNLADIPTLVQRGFPSFKVFMAYEGFRLEDGDILRLMDAARAAGGMLSVHAENGLLADRATQQLGAEGKVGVEQYPASRPAYCEHEAIQRAIQYARATGVRLHVHHVSTAEGARLIGAARREGLPLSGETCPQYLTLTEDAYRAGGLEATFPVLAPPIRTSADQAALWEALSSDALSVVATDHCPYSRAQKSAGIDDFRRVPGGMPGVETRWPLLFTHGVRAGRLTAQRLAEVWAINPARLFGLSHRKAGLSVGADADLIVVDPQRASVLSAQTLHMRTDYSMYENWPASGFPLSAVVLRGQVVVRDGQPLDEPRGQVVARTRR